MGTQIAQVEELQVAVPARDEVIAQHEEMIGHREDQIIENDALINQSNTEIEFLQEQVQDLTLELDEVPPMPPNIPDQLEGNEEEDPEEIEGVFSRQPR